MPNFSTLFITAMPAEAEQVKKVLQENGFTLTAYSSNPACQIAEAQNIDSSSAINQPENPATIPANFAGELWSASNGKQHFLLATTGIGMVNAAKSLTQLLTHYPIRKVLCVGSAGGLRADTRVNQVVVGDIYRHSGADGTAFGYQPGQVPGQPAVFPASATLLALAKELLSTLSPAQSAQYRIGEMTSSDFFVTEKNVGNIRQLFPHALTADMETQAFAQVLHTYPHTEFLAIRGISDLCGEPDAQNISFHAELATVVYSAAQLAVPLAIKAENSL